MNLRLPPLFRNFYFLCTLAFLLWMLFFDRNHLLNQYRQASKLHRLEAQRDYYQARIAEVKKDREELLTNPELLEKFAREKYLMRKPGEDVYLITRPKP